MGRRRGEPRVMDKPRQPFAKVFESAEHGQIVVVSCTDDESDPIFRVYLQAPDGRTCCHTFSYYSQVVRDEAFDSVDEAAAVEIRRQFLLHPSWDAAL